MLMGNGVCCTLWMRQSFLYQFKPVVGKLAWLFSDLAMFQNARCSLQQRFHYSPYLKRGFFQGALAGRASMGMGKYHHCHCCYSSSKSKALLSGCPLQGTATEQNFLSLPWGLGARCTSEETPYHCT